MPQLKLWRRPGSKAGIWRMRGSIGGRRYDESTRTSSRPHAEAIRSQREREILDRLAWGAERTTTFAEAASAYMTAGGEARFLPPLIERFGPAKLSDIDQAAVMAWAADRYPGIGPQGLNRQVFTPLIAIYRMAYDMGVGPAPRFKRPRQLRRAAVSYATDEDIARLRPHCSDRLWAAILLMSFTGARVAEACRLRARDIDWPAGTVTLRETKNGEPRTAALAAVVIEALHQIRGAEGLLFGFSGRHSLNQALGRACARAGLDTLTSHEIGRHAFAARLLRAGRTLKEVQEAGGWKSYRMVAETYGHLERSRVDEAVRGAGANLERLFGECQKVVSIQRTMK